MDVVSSVDESDDEPMSMNMFNYIRDRSQYRPSLDRREARYKICGYFKQS